MAITSDFSNVLIRKQHPAVARKVDKQIKQLRKAEMATMVKGDSKGAAKMGRSQKEPDLSTYRGLLGSIIRARREKLHLTPDELAERMCRLGADVTAKSIYAYETGHRLIQVDDLPAMAEALGLTVKQLMPNWSA